MKMNLKEMKTLYTFGCPNREATVERLRSAFACNVASTAVLSNLSPRCFARMNFVLPAGR